jgi:hypothetical protein
MSVQKSRERLDDTDLKGLHGFIESNVINKVVLNGFLSGTKNALKRA